MYCISCGKPQPADAAFCPYCGKQQSMEMAGFPPTVTITESSPSTGVTAEPAIALSNFDFPTTGDLEPIALYEKREWMFRYKDVANPPPAWTQSTVDLMFSEDYVVLQSNTNVATLNEKLKKAGWLASVIIAGAVPVLGITAALAVSALDKTMPRQKKHIGYGKNNQFTREAILQRFLAGEAIWAKKSECEFRALKSRLLLNTTYHYFVIIAKFHHISGLLNYAAFNCLSGIHGGFIELSGCTLAREEKFKVRSEALRSLVGYPEPPITKDRDDTWI